MATASAFRSVSAPVTITAVGREMAKASPEIPLIQEFHRYLSVEHNASSHTLDAYRRDLTQFFAFLAHRPEPQAEIAPLPKLSAMATIDHHTVRAYLAELHQRGLERATVARKLAALRTYFKFLRREGVCANTVFDEIAAPRFSSQDAGLSFRTGDGASIRSCRSRQYAGVAGPRHPGAVIRRGSTGQRVDRPESRRP